MKNTGKILRILVGFPGLLFLFWAGSDLVIERRRGDDIYFSEKELLKAKRPNKSTSPRETSAKTKSP